MKINFVFSNNFIAILIIIATLTILINNKFIYNKNVEVFNKIILENEYNKMGGEENYKILLEIQKDQMESYIYDLSENNPEYLERIRNKINPDNTEKKLEIEEIEVIQNTSPILGNKDSEFSLVEFSDFECSHCIEFHNETNIFGILEETENLNYIYKNMINRNNEDSKLASKYGKCIYEEKGSEIYFDFISYIFKGSNFDKIDLFIEENELYVENIEKCLESNEINLSLEKEFGQGIYLGISKTPSFVIINNKSGEYRLLEGKVTKDILLQSINNLKTQ